MRTFPIMTTDWRNREENTAGRVRAVGGFFVMVGMPWDMLAPHEAQAQRNHGQTLARLAERGGLCAEEALCILDGRPWPNRRLAESEAVSNAILARRVADYLTETEKLQQAPA